MQHPCRKNVRDDGGDFDERRMSRNLTSKNIDLRKN
jgi:hypothetical protein